MNVELQRVFKFKGIRFENRVAAINKITLVIHIYFDYLSTKLGSSNNGWQVNAQYYLVLFLLYVIKIYRSMLSLLFLSVGVFMLCCSTLQNQIVFRKERFILAKKIPLDILNC